MHNPCIKKNQSFNKTVCCVLQNEYIQVWIKKIAVCGGSGAEFLHNAIAQEADIYITGDYKYHQFFDAEDKIVIADIGHYESEQFTVDLIFDYLSEKFPTFALQKSKIDTNPVNYYF